MKKFELSPEKLKNKCDPGIFDFKTTEELEPLKGVIDQKRALSAINFSLGVKNFGFNLFVSGLPGSGRTSIVRKIVEEKAKTEKTPDDWCYVHNFTNPDNPSVIRFPADKGALFVNDMEDLINTVRKTIPKAFESEEYEKKRAEVIKRFQEEKEKLLRDVEELARKRGFLIQITPTGVATIPLFDGKPLKPEDLQKISPEEQKRIQEEGHKLLEEINKILIKVKKIDKKILESLQELDVEVAVFSIGHLLQDIKEKYKDVPEVLDYLENVKEDIISHLDKFKVQKAEDEDFYKRYKINLIVDNSNTKGAPVVFETNPTYFNLFGGIEYEAKMGVMVTNFNLIKAGAIHRANGGYLIVNAMDLLTTPFSWDTLKRTLKNGESRIENPGEYYRLVLTKTIKPEPIPVNLKVILIGTPYIYYLLYHYDEDFRKLFKVRADFDTSMDRTPENMKEYASFISSFVRRENIKNLTREAVSEVIDYGSRLVEDKKKISTRFQYICDIISEANYWAKGDGSEYIDRKHIKKAVEEKEFRSNLIKKKIQELIERGVILIDTEGKKVGQINGISIIQLGDYEFGKPSRITANIHMGNKGVINIEREVKLSGRIHNKGVLILSGFLGERYAKDKPLSLSATLTFEQLYEEFEGDSASSAELYALLSAIGNIPLKQNLAVTGSVNQKGEIQPVGGVNRKIEGFFDTCKVKGFTGDQGVIIPYENIDDLMLKDEVIEAVKNGKFHIYAIKTIDEGMELLTDLTMDKINDRVSKALYDLAMGLKKFGEEKKSENKDKKSQGN